MGTAQCFAVYIAALCQQHPSAIQEMLAYMLIIIRAAQEFEDPVWRSYTVKNEVLH